MSIYLGNQENLFNNIQDNSIDAIITDPPYGLKWDHKIETHFNFKYLLNLLENSFSLL